MSTYIRKEDIDAVEMDGSWIILHPVNYTVTKLNSIGGECWALLKNRQSTKSLVEEIKRQYDVSTNVIETDIENFLEQMLNAGLITK
ncbi:PqqD family protein [Bacillus timonensis]|nr:PqqD family protein [Bacillus timonensis]